MLPQKDRFSLEQEILSCWNLVEDLAQCDNLEEVDLVRRYYDMKFRKLFNLFEDLIREGAIS